MESKPEYQAGIKQDTAGFYFVDAASNEQIPVAADVMPKKQGWKLNHYWTVQEDGSRKPEQCSNIDCTVCR